uniref:Uncharacterized protein n=1 Tax=Arion vulgaris TaxID=1028688 RepID=A0A0B7BKI8_9EUPU
MEIITADKEHMDEIVRILVIAMEKMNVSLVLEDVLLGVLLDLKERIVIHRVSLDLTAKDVQGNVVHIVHRKEIVIDHVIM